jgi:hypothetical protein
MPLVHAPSQWNPERSFLKRTDECSIAFNLLLSDARIGVCRSEHLLRIAGALLVDDSGETGWWQWRVEPSEARVVRETSRLAAADGKCNSQALAHSITLLKLRACSHPFRIVQRSARPQAMVSQCTSSACAVG